MPLKDILAASDADMADVEFPQSTEAPQESIPADGLCIECGDQPAELDCKNCKEPFCSVCYNYLHRTGNRKNHKTNSYSSGSKSGSINGSKRAAESQLENPGSESSACDENDDKSDSSFSDDEDDEDGDGPRHDLSASVQSIASDRGEKVGSAAGYELVQLIKNSTKYIPMRLTYEERKLLRLLEAALNVSEYVDKVDILSYTSKAKRMVAQLKEMCSILAGLVVATDMKAGQSLFEDKEFSANAEWFQTVFEVGRRYKIMNPEKMRDSFGKLVYMIMDSRLPEVKDAMEFDLYKPINTVFSTLKSRNALDLLDDELILQATAEIIATNKPRSRIQMEIKRKERAIEILARRFSKNENISKDEIRQCLYSISDYHAYLRANRQPVEELMKMLESNFDANEIKHGTHEEFSLGISFGRSGARLSHNHTKQYHYVKQSLTLWSQIMKDMFMLWTLADDDLLSVNTRYHLSDTGQGLNRIKACPSVSRAMHNIIHKAQTRTGSWIGSSVVHLGDHTVPNALFFLDKYLQVPRILNPVYLTLTQIDATSRDPFACDYMTSQFGSIEDLKKTILCDFFKHAFDGSGADNFYDAGSCIDGRLTSAWNWANSISKKDYYKIFLLTGFTGFNGSDGW